MFPVTADGSPTSQDRPSDETCGPDASEPGGPAPEETAPEPHGLRSVRLPDRFYLPRRLQNGLKVRDLMPWRGAREYVSDGASIGMRMHDGRLLWITSRQELLLEAFREEFEGVEVDDLLRGLQDYARRRPRLKYLWQEDIAALEDLVAEREEEGMAST